MTTKAQTPLMKQYFEVKSKHPDKIVLFRMGDFYETFDTDAKIASRVLGIVLTKRSNGAAAEMPLAGFPHHALDSYLHKFLQAGLKVAICEQLEDPKKAKGLVKRGITEIVTPGTAVNDKFVDSSTNNYLASWIPGKDSSGFAFVDISTGEFRYVSAKNENIIELIEAKPIAELLIPEHDDEYIRSLYPIIRECIQRCPTGYVIRLMQAIPLQRILRRLHLKVLDWTINPSVLRLWG